MFSPSFAAARPSLSSVYHNLPPSARGKPPPAHGSASILPAPGNHCPRSPGTAPSAGPPVTRLTTICRSARNTAFRPFFTRRTQHRCSGVELPPCKHIFTPPRHTILSVRFSRAAHSITVPGWSRPPCKHMFTPSRHTILSVRFSRGAAFSFFALRRSPRRKPRGLRVCRGGVRRGAFACIAGVVARAAGVVARAVGACAAMHRKSKAEPDFSGSAWS